MIQNSPEPTPWGKSLRWLLSAIILAGMLLGSIVPATAQAPEPPRTAGEQAAQLALGRPADAPDYRPGVLLVKFQEAAASAAIEALMTQYSATYERNLYNSDVEVWQVPEGQEQSIAQSLTTSSQVVYAETDNLYWALLTPNDPSYVNQWAQPLINADDAWNITTGSASVTIAIIDTGIDESHPDLASKIVAGYDFIDGDSNPHDTNGHGTHVAGITAAIGNNGVGIAGNDWNARIMPMRVLGTEGSGYTSGIVDGVNWAYQHGAKVLNLSLGGPTYNSTFQDAITAAYNAGTIVIAAMGNDGAQVVRYPAAYNNVFAVASTTRTDTRATYSNYGSHCDIAAPGGQMYSLGDSNGIYSTMPTYSVYLQYQYGYSLNYTYLQGTSQATPQVAGLAGLMLAANPSLTPAQIQSAIQNTAVDIGSAGWDQYFGWGRINALAAVQSVAGPTIPAAPTLSAISNPENDGTYLVDWSDVSGATGYTLQVDRNGGFGGPSTAYSGPTSQFSVSAQAAGVWYYRVLASNSAGSSAWSGTQTVGVLPGAATLNDITNPLNNDSYLIAWGLVTGASGYRLEEDDNAGFTSPTVRYQGANTVYSVTGQASGTWYYRLRAYNSVGNGAWSSAKNTAVTASGVSAPTLNAIANGDGDGAYLVDWTDVGGATAYILEESRSPYFATIENTHNVAVSELTLAGKGGGTWFYRVRAVVGVSKSPWSSSRSAIVDAITFAPTLFKGAMFNQQPVTGLPITQGFESNTMPPSGWTVVQTNASETWKIATIGDPYAGSYFADVEYDSYLSDQNEVLLSPQFSADSATLSFYSQGSLYWCRDTYDNCDLNIWVVVGSWGGADDVLIYTADDDWLITWQYENTVIDLSPYISSSTPVRIGFQYLGNDGAQVGLDDISITSP